MTLAPPCGAVQSTVRVPDGTEDNIRSMRFSSRSTRTLVQPEGSVRSPASDEAPRSAGTENDLMPNSTENRRGRPLTTGLALLSTFAQFALIQVGWLLQAGWVSVAFYGVATVLFVITWVIPSATRHFRTERERSADAREKKDRG